MNTEKQIFLNWINAKSAEVKSMEAKGAKLLQENAPDEYRTQMRLKAELLAGLAQEGAPLLEGLSPKESNAFSGQLRSFSSSATQALRIGSVFYMSALLYPDEHTPGEPNNMELWIKEIQA